MASATISALGRVVNSTTGSVIVPSDLGGAYRSTNLGISWTAIGLNQGLQTTHVDAAAFHPSIDGTVFLGTEDGIYLSTNCATSPVGACTFTKKVSGFVTAVATATSGTATATTVYAGGLAGYCQAGAKLWQSTNNGATWTLKSATGLPSNANIMAIRVRPGNPNTLIALSDVGRFSGPIACSDAVPAWGEIPPNRAYISTDGGATFTSLNVPSTVPALQQSDSISGDSWAYVEDVKFDLANNAKIWLTVTANPNLGGSWWAVNGELWQSSGTTGIGNDFTWQSGGDFSHTGQIWPLTTGNIRTIDLRRQHPWDTGENGVWQWNTATSSWSRVTTDTEYNAWARGWTGAVNSPNKSLNGSLHSLTPVNDNAIWWVDNQFAFKSIDGGHLFNQQFTNVIAAPSGFNSRRLDNAVPGVLAPSPVSATTMYAGYFDMGCWLSTNAKTVAASISWKDCNGPKSSDTTPSSLNGEWHGFGGNTTAIAPDPTVANTFWAVHSPRADSGYKVAKTTNGGTTWLDLTFNLNTLSSDAPITDLLVDNPTSSTRTLWAITNYKLYKLANGSTNWVQVNTPCDGGALVMAKKGTQMLIGGAAGVCRSSNAGTNWNWWSNNYWLTGVVNVWWGAFDNAPIAVTDFAFHPTNNQIAWMIISNPSYTNANTNAGLYKTIDGGQTWSQVGATTLATGPFERNFMRTVAVHPTNANILVVGSSSATVAGGYFAIATKMGAWVSTNGGTTWSANPENTGLAWPFINRLRFTTGATPRLYGISPGQGLVFSVSP